MPAGMLFKKISLWWSLKALISRVKTHFVVVVFRKRVFSQIFSLIFTTRSPDKLMM